MGVEERLLGEQGWETESSHPHWDFRGVLNNAVLAVRGPCGVHIFITRASVVEGWGIYRCLSLSSSFFLFAVPGIEPGPQELQASTRPLATATASFYFFIWGQDLTKFPLVSLEFTL